MSWQVGGRGRFGRKRHALQKEGPVHYTRSVLEVLRELSASPVDRARLARAVLLLNARNFKEFRAVSPVGLVNTEDQAVRVVVGWLASEAHWTDIETKSRGKPAYVRKVRSALRSISKKVSYRGDWEALASALVRQAARYWGWDET